MWWMWYAAGRYKLDFILDVLARLGPNEIDMPVSNSGQQQHMQPVPKLCSPYCAVVLRQGHDIHGQCQTNEHSAGEDIWEQDAARCSSRPGGLQLHDR